MDKNNSKKQNPLQKVISRTYVSLKESSLNSNLLFFLSYIFNLMNVIIVIDIIFNYKRDFLNVYNFLYFICPVFYFEVLNCVVQVSNEPTIVNSTRYKYDQIYKLGVKTFKITPYEQKNFYDYNYYGLVYLIVICLFFIVHYIKKNNCFLNFVKTFGAYVIYLTYDTLIFVSLLIFNRTVFLQFSDDYNEIDYKFIFDVIIFLLFNISVFIYYAIFIYAFEQNEIYYFIQSKHFLF